MPRQDGSAPETNRRRRTARIIAGMFAAATAALALAAALVLAVQVVRHPDPSGVVILAGWVAAVTALLRHHRAPAWPIAIGVVAVSLLLRALSVALVDGVTLIADPMNYSHLADALRDGRGLVADDWQYGRDLRAYFPPLYPILLAGWRALFGASAVATAAMNTATDALAAWCVGDAGRRLGTPRAGRIAALAYLAWPAFALSAGVVQKESLTLLLVVLLLRGAAIWLAAPADEARRWRHGVGIGLWWGLLALTQPALLPVPVAIAAVLAWQRGLRPVARLGSAALPVAVAVLVPWWLRNAWLFGAFVPFTTASGMMMDAALGPLRAPFPLQLFDRPEPERARMMGALARATIRAHPVAFVREALRNMATAFAYEEAPLGRLRHARPPIDAATHARLAPLLQGAWAALLGAAAIAGTGMAWRRRVDPVALATLALIAMLATCNLPFEFGERHRLVLTPLLLLVVARWWGEAVAGPFDAATGACRVASGVRSR